MLTIRVAFASEQTQIFEDMRAKALRSDAETAANCLRYVVWYYPSGSKQEVGSRLDRMVERSGLGPREILLRICATKQGEIWDRVRKFGFRSMGRNKA